MLQYTHVPEQTSKLVNAKHSWQVKGQAPCILLNKHYAHAGLEKQQNIFDDIICFPNNSLANEPLKKQSSNDYSNGVYEMDCKLIGATNKVTLPLSHIPTSLIKAQAQLNYYLYILTYSPGQEMLYLPHPFCTFRRSL